MRIGVVKENASNETRVAITPDVVKKLVDKGIEIIVEKKAGEKAGFSDEEYIKSGAVVAKNFSELVKEVNVLAVVSPLEDKQLKALQEGVTVIGLLKPYENSELIKKYKTINQFALEFVPRISRAQSMDVLSSQNNLAGYRAVIEGAFEFNKAFPLMMTAAGTVVAAKVLVIGAGVAGLQAIATAKRLGAVVSAFDVRSAAKEQVQSLGATFVEVEYNESGEGTGGYAKEMSEEYKKAQSEKLLDVLKNQDIVITTALIPGKPAPVLITEEMVKAMKNGSVIVDLAIDSGGNCPLSTPGISFSENGVKIVAHSNMASRIPYNASQLYSKNLFNFLNLLINKEDNSLNINFDDEIIAASCLTCNGNIVNSVLKN